MHIAEVTLLRPSVSAASLATPMPRSSLSSQMTDCTRSDSDTAAYGSRDQAQGEPKPEPAALSEQPIERLVIFHTPTPVVASEPHLKSAAGGEQQSDAGVVDTNGDVHIEDDSDIADSAAAAPPSGRRPSHRKTSSISVQPALTGPRRRCTCVACVAKNEARAPKVLHPTSSHHRRTSSASRLTAAAADGAAATSPHSPPSMSRRPSSSGTRPRGTSKSAEDLAEQKAETGVEAPAVVLPQRAAPSVVDHSSTVLLQHATTGLFVAGCAGQLSFVPLPEVGGVVQHVPDALWLQWTTPKGNFFQSAASQQMLQSIDDASLDVGLAAAAPSTARKGAAKPYAFALVARQSGRCLLHHISSGKFLCMRSSPIAADVPHLELVEDDDDQGALWMLHPIKLLNFADD